MSDLVLLRDPIQDKLAGLVFELAQQLHVERARRMALEAALMRAGLIDMDAIVAAEAAGRGESAAAAEEAVARLMRVLTECGDAKAPLRAEALPGRG